VRALHFAIHRTRQGVTNTCLKPTMTCKLSLPYLFATMAIAVPLYWAVLVFERQPGQCPCSTPLRSPATRHCLFPSDDITIYKHQSQKRLKPIVTETTIENDNTDIANDCLRGNENAALSNATCHTVRNIKLQHQVQAPWPLLHCTMSAAKTHVSAKQERANSTAQYLSNKNDYRAARTHDKYKLYIHVQDNLYTPHVLQRRKQSFVMMVSAIVIIASMTPVAFRCNMLSNANLKFEALSWSSL